MVKLGMRLLVVTGFALAFNAHAIKVEDASNVEVKSLQSFSAELSNLDRGHSCAAETYPGSGKYCCSVSCGFGQSAVCISGGYPYDCSNASCSCQ